ncbi:MAG: PglZ domain-containing protein, partial [Prevotella sp.]|nr:PglZ domain-containing protein [Prevotella sp.]
KREIVSQVTQSSYQQSFMDISMQIDNAHSTQEWIEVYKRLTLQELKLSAADTGMMDMLKSQKEEANNSFAKFVKKNYLDWLGKSNAESQLMSNNLMAKTIFPLLDKGEKVFLIVIDNFRYDQWRVLAEDIADGFDVDEQLYTTILPTATQYARNAIFSGLMPDQIAKMFPNLWVDEDEEEGKNLNEAPLIKTQLDRYRRHNSFSYHKINDSQAADHFIQQYKNLEQYDLNVLVVNFIDMLSHARTESKMVRELANDEAAYRSITRSWFEHSVLSELFKLLAKSNYTIVLTTDHGSIRASKPVKIIGDRNTNTNLRYKLGKNLSYNQKEVFVIKNPKEAQLP